MKAVFQKVEEKMWAKESENVCNENIRTLATNSRERLVRDRCVYLWIQVPLFVCLFIHLLCFVKF